MIYNAFNAEVSKNGKLATCGLPRRAERRGVVVDSRRVTTCAVFYNGDHVSWAAKIG